MNETNFFYSFRYFHFSLCDKMANWYKLSSVPKYFRKQYIEWYAHLSEGKKNVVAYAHVLNKFRQICVLTCQVYDDFNWIFNTLAGYSLVQHFFLLMIFTCTICFYKLCNVRFCCKGGLNVCSKQFDYHWERGTGL